MNIIHFCSSFPKYYFDRGEVILKEGALTGKLYVLIDGAVEITRGSMSLNKVYEPGAIFGEISWLLNTPHIASVTALEESRCYVIEDARAFIVSHPDIGLHLATTLAQRLSSVTSYLAGVKNSLETLMKQQALTGAKAGGRRLPVSFASEAREPAVAVLNVGPFHRGVLVSQ